MKAKTAKLLIAALCAVSTFNAYAGDYQNEVNVRIQECVNNSWANTGVSPAQQEQYCIRSAYIDTFVEVCEAADTSWTAWVTARSRCVRLAHQRFGY